MPIAYTYVIPVRFEIQNYYLARDVVFHEREINYRISRKASYSDVGLSIMRTFIRSTCYMYQ